MIVQLILRINRTKFSLYCVSAKRSSAQLSISLNSDQNKKYMNNEAKQKKLYKNVCYSKCLPIARNKGTTR